jgi:hypothetical protein
VEFLCFLWTQISYFSPFEIFESMSYPHFLVGTRVPIFSAQAGVFAPLVLFSLFFGSYLFGMASFLAHASSAMCLLFIAHIL